MFPGNLFSDRVRLVMLPVLRASSLSAQGPRGPSGGLFVIHKDKMIDKRLFSKGTHRIHAIDIFRENVKGQFGPFDQFLSQ